MQPRENPIPTQFKPLVSNRDIRATECRTRRSAIINLDRVDSSIQARSKQKQTNEHDDDVDDSHRAPRSPVPQVTAVQVIVGDSEEHEAEEAVKCGAEEGEKVAHAWDDFRKNEAREPDGNHQTDPNTPSDDCVRVGVARFAQDTVEDEFGGDVSVDDADDDGRDDDEDEGSLLVD